MQKHLFKLFILLFLTLGIQTSTGWAYTLTVKCHPSNNGKMIYLGHYYGKQTIKIDSTKINIQGQAIFQTKKQDISGIYILYFDSKSLANFMWTNSNNISINLSNTYPIRIGNIEGSKEASSFLAYSNKLNQLLAKQKEIVKLAQEAQKQKQDISEYGAQVNAINQQSSLLWETEIKRYPNTFYADFMNFMLPPFDQSKASPTEMQDHYWDHFNPNRTGLIYTPIIENKLMQYFKYILPQHPDKIIPHALSLLKKCENNKAMEQYISDWMINHFANEPNNGLEKVFVVLAQNYYLGDNPKFGTPASRDKIEEMTSKMLPALVGNKAYNLKLENVNGFETNIYDIHAKHTLIVFYSPECPHCKKLMDALEQKLFPITTPDQLSFVAVCTLTDEQEWKEYIKSHKIEEWTNVWDPNSTSNYNLYYNVDRTPALFLLDEDKNIVTKNCSLEDIYREIKK